MPIPRWTKLHQCHIMCDTFCRVCTSMPLCSVLAQQPQRIQQLFLTDGTVRQMMAVSSQLRPINPLKACAPPTPHLAGDKQALNDAGVYAVKFFHNGQWVGIVIDDTLPCSVRAAAHRSASTPRVTLQSRTALSHTVAYHRLWMSLAGSSMGTA